MKLYFATFQTNDSFDTPKRRSHTVLIAEQIEIRNDQSHRKIYAGLYASTSTTNRRTSLFTNRATRFNPENLHVLSASTEESPEDFIHTHYGHITSENLQVTELTPIQMRWLSDPEQGLGVKIKLFDRMYMNTVGPVDKFISRVTRQMRERLDKPRPYAVYKGTMSYSAADYKHRQAVTAACHNAIKQAVADDDVSVFDDWIHEHYENMTVQNGLSDWFDRVKDFLDDKGLYTDLKVCDCGHMEYTGETHDVRDDTWCDACFRDDAVFVEDRNEYWSRDDAYWSDNHDAYYSYDRDSDEADEDGDDGDPSALMDYSTNVLDHLNRDTSFTPTPYSDLLMGIELEIGVGEDNYKRDAVSKIRSALGEDYVVCKYDGSLPDDGLEIVTAPRRLAHHIEQFKDWVVPQGFRAWDAKRCGMHIHIDSHGFSKLTLGKFFMFINAESNADFVRQIAGRHPNRDNQAREYCAAEHQDILTNPSKALKGKSDQRYRMINTNNLTGSECNRLGLKDNYNRRGYDTIELRIFRASLKKERLLAQIEWTHAVVMFCRTASWRDLNGEAFVAWLKTTNNAYSNLAKWYGLSKRVKEATATTCEDVTPAPEPVTTESRDVQRAQRGSL